MTEELKEKISQVLFNIDTTALEAGIAQKQIFEILEQLKPTTILGHSIEEVITILKALDLERILDIKMTMSNLSIIANKLQEDFNNSIKETIERQVKHFSDNVVMGRGNTKNE